jgi:hypothetical protein
MSKLPNDIDELKHSVFYPRYSSFIFLILVIYSLIVLLLTKDMVGNDSTTYIGYFEGWAKGRYTYWYELKDYIPDTFRNPGFPFFIFVLCLLSKKIFFLQAVQFCLYCFTLILLMRIIVNYQYKTSIPLLIFTALALINPVIPLHNAIIVPETLTGFLLVFILYIRIFFSESRKKYIGLGFLFGVLFQVRPVVFFLPFLLFVIDWRVQKKSFSWLKNATMLVIYVVSMLPYGYWNYKTHGIFSVTSLEGGGGVLHLGYWSLKMPGYTEKRYWNNSTPEGLIVFTPHNQVAENIRTFEREWDVIDSSCAKYLTEVDRKNMAHMKSDGARFVTFNGRYTYEREKLLKQLAFKHYKEDWGYTLKVKTYTAFRLWITGLRKSDLNKQKPYETIKALIAPVTTGLTLLLAVLLIPVAFYKRKQAMSYWLPMLITVIYWGGIHIPFAIQARYTIPARLLLIALTAVAAYELFFNKEKQNQE